VLYFPKTFKSTPTVIFEAGFSESYQDLLGDLGDVDDWIAHSDLVQLLIILDIVEDVPLRKVYQKSRLSSSRVAELLKVFRNSQGKAAH
jgi:hypothetical protein